MRAIDRLYKKDENVVRSVLIDQDLYEQLQHLSENVFDSSISKIINVAVENTLIKNKDIAFYKKPKNTDSIYRSILFRKTFFDEIIRMKENTGISFTRLVNGAIKEFLQDFKDELQ